MNVEAEIKRLVNINDRLRENELRLINTNYLLINTCKKIIEGKMNVEELEKFIKEVETSRMLK